MIINKNKGVLSRSYKKSPTIQNLKTKRNNQNLKKSLFDRKKYINSYSELGTNGWYK